MKDEIPDEVHRLRRRVEQLQQQVELLHKALVAILERLTAIAASTQPVARRSDEELSIS